MKRVILFAILTFLAVAPYVAFILFLQDATLHYDMLLDTHLNSLSHAYYLGCKRPSGSCRADATKFVQGADARSLTGK